MKQYMVYLLCPVAIIMLLSCSTDNAHIKKKEGCIDKNTLRIVIFVTKRELPAGKLNKDTISKEAEKIAQQRCQTIISNAIAINKKQVVQSDSYVVSWKIVLLEKRKDGYIGILDYTLHDEIASLLQCR